MEKVPATRNQQQTPSQLSAHHDDKAAKGYPAVTRFAQAPVNNNSNGLPHQLRQGVETLSGISMANTTVHYNSSAPAQIGALAYAAGNHIHLGPEQEQHLPHEAWHVVQQKQGRVKPTLQAKGLAINDDQRLETEADVMGQRAAQLKTADSSALAPSALSVSESAAVVQRKIGFEFQAYGCSEVMNGRNKLGEYRGDLFKVETDTGARITELEINTKAVDETPAGFSEMVLIMTTLKSLLEQIESKSEAAPEIDALSKKTKFIDIKLDGFEWKKELDPKAALIIHGGHLHFHPQATVGVKFEKIVELIDYVTKAPFKTRNTRVPDGSTGYVPETARGEIKEGAIETGPVPATPESGYEKKQDEKATLASVFGWSGMDEQRLFRHAWAGGLSEVNRNPQLKSPKVKGLVAILNGLAMNVRYKIAPGDKGLVKYFMPFMLRNGFRPLFDSLNEEEVKELEYVDKELLNIGFEGVAELFEQDITMLKILEDMKGKRAGTIPENKFDLLQETGGKDSTMTMGHGEIGRSPYRGDLKSWGMERLDDIGRSDTEPAERRRGAIIELRKLGNDIPSSLLPEFALAVFKFIMLINEERAL